MECQHCSGKVQDAFICRQCEVELKDMLLGLPRWLDFLHDAAVGATRLGESARRSGDLTSPMPCNLGASTLYDDTHAMLIRWVEIVNVRVETLSVKGDDE
jgi:hypothetical protein